MTRMRLTYVKKATAALGGNASELQKVVQVDFTEMNFRISKNNKKCGIAVIAKCQVF